MANKFTVIITSDDGEKSTQVFSQTFETFNLSRVALMLNSQPTPAKPRKARKDKGTTRTVEPLLQPQNLL